MDVPDLPVEEIATLVKACPRARFVLLNGAGFAGSPLGSKDAGNRFIEISRLTAVLNNELRQIVRQLRCVPVEPQSLCIAASATPAKEICILSLNFHTS